MSIFNFRRGRNLALATGVLAAGAVSAAGCLSPPVVEQQPNTSNVFVQQIVNTSINAIDLLFVIDNSVSMGDKQAILENAVPQMVERLLVPDCVKLDPLGKELDRQAGPSLDSEAGCPTDFETEFTPVNDIHVGVITSSLGAHGADTCSEAQQNDGSTLVPNVRTSLPNGDAVASTDNGFLVWKPGDGRGSEAEKDELKTKFANHVVAAGESGCGFEAPLEAWYRFLVDANPPGPMLINKAPEPLSIAMIDGSGDTFNVSQNQSYADVRANDILLQRQLFLRQESLVAIVLLTDENDCSAMDGGVYYGNSRFGWLLGDLSATKPFSVASQECETNPNGACCYSCLLPASSLPDECQAGYVASCPVPKIIDETKDRANSRCVTNKQRFGLDLLYPTQRYVDGLTKQQVIDQQTGKTVSNPLLAGSARLDANGAVIEEALRRPDDLVFFAGIVGIPWQDLATTESRPPGVDLELLNADELAAEDFPVGSLNVSRWDIILGKANLAADSAICRDDLKANGEYTNPRCAVAPIAPLDPFMRESFVARSGTNPITGDEIVVASGSPTATINGHEYINEVDGVAKNDDLQYSCIFELQDSKDCTLDENQQSCDCRAEDVNRQKPLCESPSGGAAGTTQYYAKAYPATRVLQVLKDFGGNSIVGSICPKVSSGDPLAPGFGYNPAVKAIVDRLKEKLGGACLPRELTIDENTGEVPCTVVEAKRSTNIPGEDLDCVSTGRRNVSEEIRTAVEKQLSANSFCTEGGAAGTACAEWKMCEIKQLVEEQEKANCFFEGPEYYAPGGAGTGIEAGYCYIDPVKGPSAGGRGDDCTAENTESCSNPNVLQCPAASRRQLRFVGVNTPVQDSITFVACVGESAGSGFIPKVTPGEGMGGAASTASDTSAEPETGTDGSN